MQRVERAVGPGGPLLPRGLALPVAHTGSEHTDIPATRQNEHRKPA